MYIYVNIVFFLSYSFIKNIINKDYQELKGYGYYILNFIALLRYLENKFNQIKKMYEVL